MQVSQPETRPVSKERIEAINRFWRAANYLTAGQIYLKENPLMAEPLTPHHVKERLLGHWGTSPGLSFIYAHVSRLIQDTGSKFLYITGPGHGGPALRACTWLEGCMSETYPDLSFDEAGMHKLMRDFSWPGGVPSHVSPPTPGSIHEGGELGYSLVHAYGAAFDNPDLIVACVIGDGEAETGPLAASWHSNKFLNRERDGAVLPILHLNGYKISGPTVLGRMDDERLASLFHGYGYQVRFVEGSEPNVVHRAMWEALDWAHGEIAAKAEPPMIIMRTPKGWTGPKEVDGKQVEGTFRSHQVPLADVAGNPAHLQILEQWLTSYRPDELFDEAGRPRSDVLEICPKGELRMGATPHANGGLLLKDLQMPDFAEYALDVPAPGAIKGEATRELGLFLRDVMLQNMTNFRVFCPDETASNRLSHLFEATGRTWEQKIIDTDDDLSPEGRVMEVLSEHLCQGWLEGYLLTGRHGMFPCYEAFALIVDSMLNQHAKWLKACQELPWRQPIASLNYLLTSHAWRQDHNGYSHQGPGFIESVLQKKASCARIYLPPDANCLLSVADHCLRSRNLVNLIVAGKQPMPQWLNMEEAKAHCEVGASIWDWASSDEGPPEIVLASSGDTPTLETLAAISLLRHYFPDLRVQMVNVADLFTLVTPEIHSHGMSHDAFKKLFPENIPILFAFHGHPMVIEELVFGRSGRERFFIRGYLEEGTTTTPFDMVVRNKISRYHLAREAVQRVPRLGDRADELEAEWTGLLERHKRYIYEHGQDLPEVLEWQWRN